MKKLLLLLAVLQAGIGMTDVYSARVKQNPSIEGRVTDENEAAVEYATIVLLSASDSHQVTGATSDAEGRFALSAPQGDYVVKIYYLGYEDYIQAVSLEKDLKLGDIKLQPSANEMDAVTVTARTITREADRFVVNIANNPAAIGKDAFEMLKQSPGVWISKDGITINGKGGTRVMINDRILRMDSDQLESYLRSIKAEDIVKIEVIPDAGADYDADSRGGIVKITLAKQRNDGIEGSVSAGGEYGKYGGGAVFPSANVNYQAGRLNLYTSLGYRHNKLYSQADEVTKYMAGDLSGSDMKSDTEMDGFSDSYNARLGMVYEMNPKHSIGAEFGYYQYSDDSENSGNSLFRFRAPIAPLFADSIVNKSVYLTDELNRYYSGTVNYVWKMDTLGSTFKIIGDYNQSVSDNRNDYDNKSASWAGGIGSAEQNDITRSRAGSDYLITSLSADVDIVRSPVTTFKTGAKFTFNKMYSDTRYEELNGGVWQPSTSEDSKKTDYTENIGALYFIYNTRLGKVGLSAGIRGEYTYIIPKFDGTASAKSDDAQQSYFSFFPNLNVSVPLNKTFSNSLIFSYSRRISRPGFWALNPSKIKLSEYSEIVGNPDLKPTFSNNISLTTVLAYKYSLTIGAQLLQDEVAQIVVRDQGNEDKLLYRFENISSSHMYYAALNAPITITKWWTLNLNLTGLYQNQKLPGEDKFRRNLGLFSYSAMNFSLPLQFDIEVTNWYQSRAISGNMEGEPQYNFGVGVKKRFLKNKFTASLGAMNILDRVQVVHSYDDTFNRSIFMNNGNALTVNFSLRYNFQAGVKVRAKQVDRGSGEDQQRIGGGGSQGGER